MNDTTLSYPSMSQPPPASSAPSADSSTPAGMEYDMSDNTSAGVGEADNFNQAAWPSEAREAVKVATEFLANIDPDKALYAEMWNKDLGGGRRRGDSLIHIAAVARAAEQAQRRMHQRLGTTRDGGEPQLTYHMPMSQSQRYALVREFRDILSRELLAADAEFIQRSKRGIVSG